MNIQDLPARALDLADERLKDLVDSLHVIVWEATIADGRDLAVTFVCEGAARLLGFQDARGWDERGGLAAGLHPEDRVAFDGLCRSLSEASPRHPVEFRITAVDGQPRWFAGDVRLISAGFGRRVRVVAVDVTERRQAVEVDVAARQELEEQLRQSQKMEAVGRLAAGVAHDFNNLLLLVSGHSEVLLASVPEGSRLHKAAEAVQRATDRATLLTQQLLAFSKRQLLKPRVLDLNNLIGGMTPLLQTLLREDIELVLRRSSSIRLVKADPTQLERVVLNLAANARDAMPKGGTLRLSVDEVVVDAARRVGDLQPGRYARLTVSDTGAGMDPETQHRIFEPFFTTKPRGTGLGLASVYGIIAQSGGHITVSSEIGKGSTFTLLLPHVEETVEVPCPDVPAPAVVQPTGAEIILLVEDEDAVRSLLRESLEAYGYTVLEARGGAEAMAVAGWHTASLDLLVTDLIMPQMNGRELADRLRAERPSLRVLFITGYSDSTGEHELIGDLLHKPFTGREFARKVREVLDTRV